MLVAVVGPSGAGKDTLMAATRARLRDDPRFRFVRRNITRPTEVGGEDHVSLDRPNFLARRQAGGFALWWEAHGLLYGIPRDIEADLAAGRSVIANLSRTVLEEADARYRLLVLEITAPPDLLAARLAARGREDAAMVASRLARAVPLPADLRLARVVNDGPVEAGVAQILAILRTTLGQMPVMG